jgi:hypothetical protein
LFVFSGCKKNIISQSKLQNQKAASQTQEYVGQIPILLYFPDSTVSYLVPEQRIAEYNTSLEKTIMQELLKGSGAGRISPIPKGTRLLSIGRKGSTINLNLSREFVKNHPGGSTGELMTVYTIVNSLTEIPGIRNVVFKVEGKNLDTLAGHMTLNKPIERNRSLFKMDKSLTPSQLLKRQMTYEAQGKWVDAYVLMSDDPDNPDRKYYTDYVSEMEEVKQLGFTSQKFDIGNYTLEPGGNKAKVKVDFYNLNPDGTKQIINTAYFNTVKVDGVWMVDWLTTQ